MEEQRPTGEGKHPGGEMNSPSTGETTPSQLLPIRANWADLPKNRHFLPGVAIVVTVVVLFSLAANPETILNVSTYSLALAAVISLDTGIATYRMVGKRCAWWVMPVVAALGGILATTGLGTQDTEVPDNASFTVRFVKMFFSAGLPQELTKAIPVAVGVWIALKVKDRMSPVTQLGVYEPLDGILIGAAAGLGFAFVEAVSARNHALQLLIPRLLGDICGHAAWAGTFGYYIGLAFYKPTNRAKTLAIGLAIAASCHAAWDSTNVSTNVSTNNFGLQLLVGLVSFALLMAVIAKARELSPNRGALMVSQLVDSLSRIIPGGVKAVAPMPQTLTATTPVARPAPQESMTWNDSNVLFIEIGTARIPVTPGARLYERQAPGAESMNADNIVGEVNSNPNDPNVLGIKNVSTQTWHVTTVSGEKRELATGRSVRLTRGMHIRIGDLSAIVK